MPVRDRITRTQAARLAGIAAIVIAAVLLVFTVLRSDSYTVNARFVDAGQLVKGDLVQVAGKPVGTISDIRLTDDNEAEVELKIKDADFDPLHKGTVARIKAVGLSGIANRFVDLRPGPAALPEIADGGTIPTADSRPYVDLDQLLNTLDPPTRNALRKLIREGASIYGNDAASANRAIAYLNPATAQGRALLDEIMSDQAATEKLITSSSVVAKTLARHSPQLAASVSSTATALSAIAREHTALADTLDRAPAVLTQATGTLARTSTTLQTVRPALRAARPSVAPLADVLRRLPPTVKAARPTIAKLVAVLPDLRRALDGATPLARAAVPALGSATTAVQGLLPILTGLRPYAPDVVFGFFNGFGGTTAASFDANGHYARIAPVGGQAGLTGLQSLIPPSSSGFMGGTTFGLVARCPGAAIEPASDNSNPYVEDASTCKPKAGK